MIIEELFGIMPHRSHKEHWTLIGVPEGNKIPQDITSLRQLLLDRAEHENFPLHVSSIKIEKDFIVLTSDSKETTDWFLKNTIYSSKESNNENKIIFYLHPQGLVLKEIELEENLDFERMKHLVKWQNAGLETNGWICLGKKEIKDLKGGGKRVKYLIAVDYQTLCYVEKHEAIYLGLSKIKLHHFDNRLFETTWYGSPQKHPENYFGRSDLKEIDSDKFLHLVLTHFCLNP